MKLNLQVLRRRPAAQELPAKIDEVVEAVDDALRQVRTMALDLRPPQLDDLGLATALRSHAERLAATSRLRIDFAMAPLPQLPPGLDIACFRIVQEALTNIIRHAAAKHVRVELRPEDDTLHLGNTDDGKGFDRASVHDLALRGHSMGLLNMEERARLVGGSLRIKSSPGAGTEIRAEFPLAPAQGQRNAGN